MPWLPGAAASESIQSDDPRAPAAPPAAAAAAGPPTHGVLAWAPRRGYNPGCTVPGGAATVPGGATYYAGGPGRAAGHRGAPRPSLGARSRPPYLSAGPRPAVAEDHASGPSRSLSFSPNSSPSPCLPPSLPPSLPPWAVPLAPPSIFTPLRLPLLCLSAPPLPLRLRPSIPPSRDQRPSLSAGRTARPSRHKRGCSTAAERPPS
jgi:hypothetical protein